MDEFDEGRWVDAGSTQALAPTPSQWAAELRTVANTIEALQPARDASGEIAEAEALRELVQRHHAVQMHIYGTGAPLCQCGHCKSYRTSLARPAGNEGERRPERRALPPDAPCTCGDVLDEHRDGRECTVEGCDCCHFEHCPAETKETQ